MTMGKRLKEERNRIGANQTVCAEKCGVTKNTQLAYEKDERSPDAAYLASAAAIGIDVLYVITGERKPQPATSLSAAEADLLRHYRELPEADQVGAARMVSALAEVAGRYQVK